VQSDGLIHLARPRIAIGTPVRVQIAGGLDAVYAGVSARQRQTVLIQFLGRQVRVELKGQRLQAAP
jgi:hypothetical protein